MDSQNKQLLKQLLDVSKRVILLAKNLNGPEDLEKNNYIFDDLLLSVASILDISHKLPTEIKEKILCEIKWEKIDNYDKIIRSDYHQLDLQTLWKAINEDLPYLVKKLENYLNNN